MFRDQQGHLEHKHRLEEERKREEAKTKEYERQQRWVRLRRWFDSFLKLAIVMSIFALLWFGTNLVIDSNDRWKAREFEERITAHHRTLEAMKTHVPRGVDPILWVWCIDHCARYKNHNSEFYSEGIVEGRLRNYNDGFEHVSVAGPWLSPSGERRKTIEVTDSTRDLNSNRFYVGDLVRLHYINDGRYTIISVQRLHQDSN